MDVSCIVKQMNLWKVVWSHFLWVAFFPLISLYFERLIFIPNQCSFDLASNAVAFYVNLTPSLDFREWGQFVRGYKFMCKVRWPGLWWMWSRSRVQSPWLPRGPCHTHVPFFCCPELASRSPPKRTRMNTAGSTSGDTRASSEAN